MFVCKVFSSFSVYTMKNISYQRQKKTFEYRDETKKFLDYDEKCMLHFYASLCNLLSVVPVEGAEKCKVSCNSYESERSIRCNVIVVVCYLWL